MNDEKNLHEVLLFAAFFFSVLLERKKTLFISYYIYLLYLFIWSVQLVLCSSSHSLSFPVEVIWISKHNIKNTKTFSQSLWLLSGQEASTHLTLKRKKNAATLAIWNRSTSNHYQVVKEKEKKRERDNHRWNVYILLFTKIFTGGDCLNRIDNNSKEENIPVRCDNIIFKRSQRNGQFRELKERKKCMFVYMKWADELNIWL